ncbi:MAG: S8 family serine peptidase [Aliifodinibius sp.]|nr:S8 family serine peptidase [candidate division Zixibacteria bacterium]NIT55075.1 S8 family serine peptidase [Fodinibius sp.]NIS44622.1 S8 family serine peptidase [candidate division Zixibacteria bacterium]NIU12676.1 S8 family serine peptidase [candidate division Zixibacteria bacterium]NIV04791.1 S8 family serine peptidase [candidate division Zixibacteria bacterium]
MSQLFTVRFSQFVPIDSLVIELEQLQAVRYAHGPIQAVSLSDPSDPDYNATDQWNLFTINASQAWDISKGLSSVVVGVLEFEGVPDLDHDDFILPDGTSKFVPGFGNTSPEETHASRVAGIVGAATDDGDGIASLGWNIRMIPYRFTSFDNDSTNGNTLVNRLATAIADSVDVINCSFVTVNTDFYRECFVPGEEEIPCLIYNINNDYQSVSDLIENAITQGIVVVAGTGNTGWEITNQNQTCEQCLPVRYTPYPAAYPGVIGVSATDINDQFGESSSGITYNPDPQLQFIDVAAPGIDILSTKSFNGYNIERGTSFSSPHTAALAGLILSIDSTLTPAQVEKIMISSALDLGDPGRDQYFGHGRIDAYDALVEAPPNAPKNLVRSIVNPAKNPRVDWDANPEPDLNHYKVEKRRGTGNWNVLTTTNTYFIDTSEEDVDLNHVPNETELKYRVSAVDDDNKESLYSETVTFFQEGSSISKRGMDKDGSSRPVQADLAQNYPNPFNPTGQWQNKRLQF